MRRLILSAACLILAATGILRAGVMPDLRGLSPDSVRSLLASDSLTIVVQPDFFYTDSLPPGVVGWQRPMPGSFLADTVKIRLVAPLSVEVPNIVGMPRAVAQALLDSLKLVFTPLGEVESDYPVGSVAIIAPEAGSLLKRGDAVNAKISIGIPTYRSVRTREGVEIHLYGRPEFKIASVSLSSSDSSGFVLSLSLEIRNPYEHSITAEALQSEFQVNTSRIVKVNPETSIKVAAKGVTRGKLRIPLSYADISAAAAKFMLGKANYRLVGTYTLKVESGFTRMPFDAGGEFNIFTSSSKAKTKLSEIATPKE